MSNWYYVVGSERIGPISEEMMRALIKDGEITADTYVWKKGFQGWERKKDVAELQFSHIDDLVVEEQDKNSGDDINWAAEEVKGDKSPEISFSFHWDNVRESEELFYVRIGKDRKNFSGSDVYGPYSLVELREALEERRINNQTLIFSPGMSSWMKVQHTPQSAGLHGGGAGDSLMMSEVPLMLVLNHSPLPLITLIKKTGTKECSVLGSGPFAIYQGQTILASLYAGNEIKARNIKVRIENYHTKEQIVDCQFEDLDSEARKIMLNHAV